MGNGLVSINNELLITSKWNLNGNPNIYFNHYCSEHFKGSCKI